LVVFCGCASFANLSPFGRQATELDKDPSQQYVVEMANMMGQSTTYEGQLEENMTVQTALVRSGATRRYRNMEIAILRTVEGTGYPLRMVVRYSPAQRMVVPEEDYALLPGDRIYIKPGTGLFDQLGGKR
jgi:hypothetical protein